MQMENCIHIQFQFNDEINSLPMETIFSGAYSFFPGYLLGSVVILWCLNNFKTVYDICANHMKMRKHANQFPGPPTIPILGNVWTLLKNREDSYDLIMGLAREYSTCRFWLGPRLFISLTDPQHIEIVMKSQETSNKSFGHAFLEPTVINCLFNGNGPKMRARRKVLVPIINGVHLKHYTKVFNEHTRCAVDDLAKRINMGEFDIYDEIEPCIADMAFETIFGIPGVARNYGDLSLPHASVVILERLYHRVITPWLHPSFMFRCSKHGRAVELATETLHQFIRKVIREKRELHVKLQHGDSSVDKPGPSILDIWMEDIVKTNESTDDEILYEMIALFIGFHDTIIGVFAFTMLTLAMHPDIQEKVRNEVISVIGIDADVTEESVGKLQYIRMVILETIRLFPVGPIIPRSVTSDLEIDKYVIPKGSTVMVATGVTHRSKKYWDEPEKFIPERFTPENSKDRHQFAFIPFSGGSRRCPGSKFGLTCLKVMIAQIVREFQLNTTMKLETLRLKTHISVRSQDGYKVSIRKIDHT